MGSVIEKRFISHQKIFELSVELGLAVAEDRFSPQLVVAIWRGGSLPCHIVHEVLQRTGQSCDSFVVTVQSYQGIANRGSSFHVDGLDGLLNRCRQVEKVLIVDDIVDTGHTMHYLVQTILDQSPQVNIKTAVLFARSLTAQSVDFCQEIDDRWLVFPHELQGLTADELSHHEHLSAPQIEKLLTLSGHSDWSLDG